MAQPQAEPSGASIRFAPTPQACGCAAPISREAQAAIESGDMARAAERLGKLFQISGTVQHGAKLGRTLDFPTANIPLTGGLRPPYGIYACLVDLEGRVKWPGLAYVGRRPTVDNGQELLEVHLYDFDSDLYGHVLCVSFVEFIRPDRKFSDLEALQAQMVVDKRMGREILASCPYLDLA